MRFTWVWAWALLWGTGLLAQPNPDLRPLFSGTRGAWADSVLSTLSLEEKIGQLFMVPAYSAGTNANATSVRSWVTTNRVGGVIFMQGNAAAQVALANDLQQRAKIPLLISQDSEWGAAMRLSGVKSFPKNLTLGAVQNDSLLYAFGKAMAEQCRALGVHVNFAPVVDVNNNPANPVINYRSFGDKPGAVANAGRWVMRGLQDHGVIAVAKHFPGHGDTNQDSHLVLPTVPHGADRLQEVELAPFETLIRQGVLGVMVAHLQVPALENTPHLPTTLSPKVVNDLLVNEMGFQGLIFTDALNMGGATQYHKSGEIEVKALEAGNDVLLFPTNLERATAAIRAAVATGRLTEARINHSVRKILWAKEWLWLHKQAQTPPSEHQRVVNNRQHLALRRQLYRAALTLVNNDAALLPLKNLDQQRIAYVQVGSGTPSQFYHILKTYARVDYHALPAGTAGGALAGFVSQLKNYTAVLIGVYGMHHRPPSYGVPGNVAGLLQQLKAAGVKTVSCLFGSPYAVAQTAAATAQLVAYEAADEAQIAAAEAIFGGYAPAGKLPVTLAGVLAPHTDPLDPYTRFAPRFGFAAPEDVGLNPDTLAQLRRLFTGYIQKKAMPGCALLIARGNRICYAEGFGGTTYPYERGYSAVDPYGASYDLASVTKVAATTLAAMKLYEEGRLNLFAPVGHYLPELRDDDKGKALIVNLLRHDADLPAWIPYFLYTQRDSARKPELFAVGQPKPGYSLPVADDLFLQNAFRDTIWNKMLAIERRTTGRNVGKYKYSDFSMIFLAEVLERILGERLESYLQREFYAPLGMNKTYFNPALKCAGGQLPPTMQDDRMRHVRIEGYVNDNNAQLLGGYAGHAGLFSNVYDLAKLLTMLAQGGVYGGKRYLKATTIWQFTARQNEDSRRGLGWDKPEPNRKKPTPIPRYASPQTYGHLGFTGTAIWVDPTHQLTFILLANRTWPELGKDLYVTESVRPQAQSLMYRALAEGGDPTLRERLYAAVRGENAE